MLRKLAVALVVPVLALSACAKEAAETPLARGTASSGPSQVGALASLQGAPDAAAAAGSARFEVTMSMATPAGPIELTSSGAYSGDRLSMSLDLGEALAGLAAGSGDTLPAGFDDPMEIVVDGTTAYLRVPMLQALTGQAGWMSATTDELAASGNTLAAGANDPTQVLEMLRGVADDIEEVGTEDVRGVPTTHLRGTVDLARALDQVPAEQRSALESQLEAFKGVAAEIPVDVWVDDDGLVRRLHLDLAAVASGAAGTDADAGMTIELFDYGEAVAIEVPPADQVTPFTEVMGGFGAGLAR